MLPLLLAAGLALLAGCATSTSPMAGPHYVPSNVHVAAVQPKVRRVALLPIAPHRGGGQMATGIEDLAPVLETELRKTAAFEVVQVSERQLLSWFGQTTWRADQMLPQNFLARLQQETGCDAVLFPTLTAYRPYPPLAIGLDLRLVAGVDLTPFWAVDEVLDAGSAPVARGARGYGRTEIIVRDGEEAAVLQSPRFFARYVCATLFATLPSVDKSLQESSKPTKTLMAGTP